MHKGKAALSKHKRMNSILWRVDSDKDRIIKVDSQTQACQKALSVISTGLPPLATWKGGCFSCLWLQIPTISTGITSQAVSPIFWLKIAANCSKHEQQVLEHIVPYWKYWKQSMCIS